MAIDFRINEGKLKRDERAQLEAALAPYLAFQRYVHDIGGDAVLDMRVTVDVEPSWAVWNGRRFVITLSFSGAVSNSRKNRSFALSETYYNLVELQKGGSEFLSRAKQLSASFLGVELNFYQHAEDYDA